MDLPIYCVVDARPVKVVASDDDQVEVLAFDVATGEFVQRMDLLERVLMQDDWVVELTEDEFQAHLERLSNGKYQRVG